MPLAPAAGKWRSHSTTRLTPSVASWNAVLAPIPLFVIGVAAGAIIIEVLARRGVRSTAAVVLGLEACLLLAVLVVGDAALSHGEVDAQKGWTFYGLIVLAATESEP